jgi:hypothetical protein
MSAILKRWALGFVALCLVACGGKSVTGEEDAGGTSGTGTGGTESGDALSGRAIPPRGFYRKSIMTVSDTCTWSATAAGDISLVGTSPTGLAAPLGPSNFRQDVPWQGLSLKLPACNAVVSARAVSRDATSFVLDVSEDWPMPQKCGLQSQQVPADGCAGEWLETFKLLAACPTTVAQMSCD